MSSIKTTAIDGDLAVGRNVSIGGKATIQGKTHFKGRVKIDGWLEARNIQGANKGMFATLEKLQAAYSLPHDGWWAIVGDTLPGPIYVAEGGKWLATGEVGGNPTIDSEEFIEATTGLISSVEALESAVKDIEEYQNTQDTEIDGVADRVAALERSTNSMQTELEALKDEAWTPISMTALTDEDIDAAIADAEAELGTGAAAEAEG